MTWTWIALLVLVVLLLAVVGGLLLVLRRLREVAPAPAAQTKPVEAAAIVAAEPDPAEVEARVRRLLQAREQELESLAGEQQRRAAELERLQAETARAAEQAAAQLAETERTRAATEEFAAGERQDLRALRTSLEGREQRLAEREERLLAEGRTLETRSAQMVEIRDAAEKLRAELETERERMRVEHEAERERQRVEHQERLVALEAELQRVAALDPSQARAEVMARVEHESRLEATALSREIEQKAHREAEQRARGIIVTAIQRLAAEQTSESVVSTLDLPSDEMKGRIIGREGRNIRHFEQVTGVNVMIDDTPGSVLLSCFDPVRREVARLTLQELVEDGRIHPARIEEVYERSRDRIEQRCLRAAEDALAEVGISDLDPDLVPVLGSLRYRTSYGQNVLRHLVECAHLAGMMASELGLDVAACTRAAFLHDIGKALTHEVEGSHALVGAELARKHGESPDIVHAIEAHHNEVEPTTVEAILTQAADAISGSRPGARRESLEAYVHRLERLEEIAASHDGVDRVFAMQAGREVRVMVSPEEMDDIASHALARDIAHEIQSELTYPGQIRVTVVRESRATEIAH
ncbi:ribonuclease Y [Luteococcus peritonei]|uniref:Ribonuclease Y n=1 Tax=Luteococcus peritonei TaxID=88874 RepID=A0ABW4RTR4_9ACTN